MTNPDVEIRPSAYAMTFPLAWVAGYVDAVGFLTLAGLFVAHMSGNTVRLGVFVGGGDWSLAVQRFVPIVFFTLFGIALCEALSRRSTPAPARVLGLEAALLLVFMLVGRAVVGSGSTPAGSWDYYLLAIVVVVAMGLQNVALRLVRASRSPPRRRHAPPRRRRSRRLPPRPLARRGLAQLPRRRCARCVHRPPLGPLVAHAAGERARGPDRVRCPARRTRLSAPASLTVDASHRAARGRDRRFRPRRAIRRTS
jgi:hypothetical protein